MNYQPILSLSICIIFTLVVLWYFEIIQFKQPSQKPVKKSVKFADDPNLNLDLEEEFRYIPDNMSITSHNENLVDQIWSDDNSNENKNIISENEDSIEVRNKLSQINDNIFICNWNRAFENYDEYKVLNITNVIALPEDSNLLDYCKKNLTESGVKSINVIRVKIPPPGGDDIKKEFKEFKELIEPMVEANEKVLVFCDGGVTTSPLFVAGFIAEKENRQIMEVVAEIKKKHPATYIDSPQANKI